jgi:DnaA-homolog protein
MSVERVMPKQLPLPIQLRAQSVFSSYLSGPNAAAVDALRRIHQPAPSPVTFVYGPPATGKTHLLQALCARATEQAQRAAYIPLRELSGYGPELLAGAEHLQLLCLDDAAVVLSSREWNHALFTLHREFEERGGRLVLADEQSPAAIAFHLRDLSSRVLAGTLLRLQTLDESQQVQALQLHAAQRGFELPDEVAVFLLRRSPRDMNSLCAFIDELDVALLAAQRRLTVPFVRSLLGDS